MEQQRALATAEHDLRQAELDEEEEETLLRSGDEASSHEDLHTESRRSRTAQWVNDVSPKNPPQPISVSRQPAAETATMTTADDAPAPASESALDADAARRRRTRRQLISTRSARGAPVDQDTHAGTSSLAETTVSTTHHDSDKLAHARSAQRGSLGRVQRKIWAAADFQNFVTRPKLIRADQEKKEVRKRRASICRTSPSDAVDYFLVSHVITGIVVIEFVISISRRLGAISTTLNGHLLITVAWSSSLSSTSSSRNVKTAASFCRCAGACRHGSSRSWVSFLHQVVSFAAPFGLGVGAAALARCVFIWIVASIERAIALYHHGRARSSRLSCSVRPQCIFSGGPPAVTR